MKLRKNSLKGVALPLVLWAVFVMSAVLVTVVGLVDFDLDLESLSGKRSTARQLAMTGIALGSHPQIKPDDQLLHQSFPDGTRLDVVIQSEDARLNINQMLTKDRTSDLQKLFQFWGVTEKEAQVAVDSLKDWVDGDEFRGLNGAEASDLRDQTEYSLPENRPFIHVAEMKKVKGMEAVAKVKPDWADYFSVRSSGKLDLQEVSTDLLQTFGGLSPDQAESVVTYRLGPDEIARTIDDPKIQSVEALTAVVPLNALQLKMCRAWFGGQGQTKRIVSRGTCGGLVHEISAVGGGSADGKYLEWIER